MATRMLTVRTALELDVFSRTDVRVYSGSDHLDRPVRWVHTGEIPDIHRFLSGGEMLLTAGLGMGSDADSQAAFVRRVADAGAAVLVLELAGRMFSSMPIAAIDAAAERGLPLVGLRDEIPFAQASAQVHEMLVELRHGELVAEEAASQAFMDLLLAGEDCVGIAGELARRAGAPAVLENANHQIVTYAGATPVADAITSEWDVHSRASHERHADLSVVDRGAPRVAAGAFRDVAACARRPVVLLGETWGWLHLLHGDHAPEPAALATLGRACAAIAVTLLGEREHGARAAKHESALISRLLVGDVSGDEFIAQAMRLGHDLRDRPLVVVVATGMGEPDQVAGGRRVVDVAAALRGMSLPAVVGELGDLRLAVVGMEPQIRAGDPRRGPIDDTELAGLLAADGVWGGVSRTVAASALGAATRQARTAATAAGTFADRRPVLRFADLGALRLLVDLAEGPVLAQYVEDELGVLLHHDAGSPNPLLPTLRVFLEHGGNKSRAAEVLFVQRRTLYYRLERISAILGLDLEEFEVQHRLHFAVRGHDLVSRQAGRVRDDSG